MKPSLETAPYRVQGAELRLQRNTLNWMHISCSILLPFFFCPPPYLALAALQMKLLIRDAVGQDFSAHQIAAFQAIEIRFKLNLNFQ